jgi:hypothetical protein
MLPLQPPTANLTSLYTFECIRVCLLHPRCAACTLQLLYSCRRKILHCVTHLAAYPVGHHAPCIAGGELTQAVDSSLHVMQQAQQQQQQQQEQ